MYYDSYVALYLRLSLEDTDKGSANDESNSIHSQKMLLSRFVESNPELQKYGVKTYIDDGYSGTNFDRPQFQELLKDIKKNKIYCIIVKDLSRFGRNYIEVGEYLEHIFPLLGIRFISVNDNYDSDKLIGTTGGIEVAFKNLIHQKYSQDASEKVKAAMHLKMGKGQYVNHCPFGYTKEKGVKHKMIIDPITAPIVKEIFQLAISGMSSVQIAKHLNEKNTITPSQRKNSSRKINNDVMWSHQAVIRIIKDYKYTGAMVNFKCENETIRAKAQRRRKPEEWVVMENMHEPIVTHEEYELANSKLRKVKPCIKTKRTDVVIEYYCAHCGRILRKTYGLDEYYSCTTATYKESTPCKEIRLAKKEIEGVLLEIFKKQMELGFHKYANSKKREIVFDKKYFDAKRQLLESNIEKAKARNFELYELYRDNSLTAEQYTEQKSELVAQIKNYKNELIKLDEDMANAEKKQEALDKTYQELNEYANIMDDAEKLLEMMRMSINRVVVHSNDDIEVHWKNDNLFIN